MQLRKLSTAFVLLVLTAWSGGPVARAQTVTPGQPEVLAQGPLHEAFAQPPTLGSPQPGPIVSAQPPAPIEELPPDQKPDGANVQWIPGYWQWDDSRNDFIWVSGVWRDLPPGEQWVPGTWQQVSGGWQRVSGFWAPAQQGQLSYLPAPPASLDLGPSAPAPSPDYFYDPGCWVFRSPRYLWRPGCWRRFRPGFVWSPAGYAWTPNGCVFNNGYWDYPLASRGLLFAPAYFPQRLLAGWRGPWTPQYVVSASALPGALFAGPGRNYYFGNYYAPRYRRAGYTPWYDYRVGRGVVDPLFASSRYNLGGASWERNLRGLYASRTSGRGVTVVAPLARVSRQGVPLTRINRAERLRQAQRANQRPRVVARSQAAPRVVPRRSPARVAQPPRSRSFAPGHAAVRRNAPHTAARPAKRGGHTFQAYRPAPRVARPARPAAATRHAPARPAARHVKAPAKARASRPVHVTAHRAQPPRAAPAHGKSGGHKGKK